MCLQWKSSSCLDGIYNKWKWLFCYCSWPWGDHQGQWVWQEDPDQWWVSHIFWSRIMPEFSCTFMAKLYLIKQISTSILEFSDEIRQIFWSASLGPASLMFSGILGTHLLNYMVFQPDCWCCNPAATLPVWFARCYQLCTPSSSLGPVDTWSTIYLEEKTKRIPVC